MKHALFLFLLLLLMQILSPYWWWIVVLPFVYGALFLGSGWLGFRTGMLGAGLLWLLAALLLWSTRSRIIAQRVASLLRVGSPLFLVLITGFLAAVVGGIAGTAGVMMRKVFPRGG